jgi:ATP-dependent NAD(P)H-hydrate dehydratase
VLVIGGSAEYTGAPYYAGMAALRAGADLVWVACGEGAAVPLKCLSPELMVLPVIPRDPSGVAGALTALEPILRRVHALVVGPGLGRSEGALAFASEVLKYAKCRSPPLPCVVDADALFLLSVRPEVLDGHPCALLTPNVMELERLNGKALGGGIIILRKDIVDCVLHVDRGGAPLEQGELPVLATIEGGGSPRRCGGQGDVLAGAAGTFLAWAAEAVEAAAAHASQGGESEGGGAPAPAAEALSGGTVAACAVGASCVVRLASAFAFDQHKRGMLTPDVLKCLPQAFEQAMELVDSQEAH